ncbi:MAG: PorP/SprF family type IX secretion system membrane protein [Eudoraea sp.]|nr:PorP/SprF family type IX secretion system membrane protein [Eudoraea sp.]
MGISAQEPPLPQDFRQHNLTESNSSLMSPVFTLDRNNPQSIAVWSRWQWQQIDGDPTTLFVNYTRKINSNSSLGAGFIQHNTGIFWQTGAVLNYAYSFAINPDFQIALGVNVFGYQQELADDRFQQSPNISLPFLDEGANFIMQAAPGVRFKYRNVSLGFVSENLFDYNFNTKESETLSGDKIFLALASYEFSLYAGGFLEDAQVRPTVYLKTLPNLDTQYGITTLFTASKLWAQLGYNNFYGISGGIGGRFFKNFSVGALIETGLSTDLDTKDPSFEIVTSYHFGKSKINEEMSDSELEQEVVLASPEEPKEPVVEEEVVEIKEIKEKKLSRKERKKMALAREQQSQDSLAAVEIKQAQEKMAILKAERIQDSIQEVKLREAEAARKLAAEEKPREGERYEEMVTSGDIQPGYYLIANVYRTKTYFQKFMKTLKDKGLDPKSFYSKEKNFNYVYLERYNTLTEARKARDSEFYGKYSDTTWIFRIKGK